jgi:hypothetical protein
LLAEKYPFHPTSLVTDPADTLEAVKVPADEEVPEIDGVESVIPLKVKSPVPLFKATCVVPIYIVELFAALSPVFVPELVPEIDAAAPVIVKVLGVVPPVIVNPSAADVNVNPLMLVKVGVADQAGAVPVPADINT